MDSMVGQAVVITGAATGIGRSAALLLAAEGAHLVLGDINHAEAQETVREITEAGGKASSFEADVSDDAQVRRLMAYAADTLGAITTVVNNAGVQRSGAVEHLDVRDWDLMMAVNARSCFLTARHVVPHLRKAGGGVIVNTASLAGVKGGPGMTGYSASKGAIVAFSKALAMELAPDAIRVNCLCPGWIDTPFNRPAISYLGGEDQHRDLVRRTVPLGRQGTVYEAAQALLFLCSPASSYMTGQVLVVDGGVF
ncbi:short-chain dehydrogenase [Phytohabitans suffuscus]|uniref:Short-chain dehydrogenase n=1 Tax=Phytohabitans suffuscus TaxID=624315 RepID=A0A6F8YET0_9ACTN|nr:SDR family NAD(P)-dependent oxidoreductase [Phytohabitans suffuscus]BCB84533.1 short-chain dehydrogenase [Phytohabitans suffuscus]